MSKINVVNVKVVDKIAKLTDNFDLQVTFDCIEYIAKDLEWKLIYVGSAETPEYDQVLDSVLVGPITVGKHKFSFQSDGPNPDIIPQDDIIGVTVLLLTCSYDSQEFVRIGYYINNEYESDQLKENPPAIVDVEKIQRCIMVESPRVTRFKINWDGAVCTVKDEPESNKQEVELESNIQEMEPESNKDAFVINDGSEQDNEEEDEVNSEDDSETHSETDIDNESTDESVEAKCPTEAAPLSIEKISKSSGSPISDTPAPKRLKPNESESNQSNDVAKEKNILI